MKCSDYVQWIAQEVDGTLPGSHERELQAHLSGCSRCRAELLLQRRILEALAQEVPSELPADFTRRVSEKALARARVEKRSRWFASLAPAFAFAVGIALLWMLRADLARVLLPATDALADTLAAPVIWMGHAILGGLARISDFPSEHLQVFERVSGPLVTTLTVTILSAIPALWAFLRAIAFLKE
ncbi:MAG: zf-HC2 domain-containing protein [Candidatus Eisenbacteria sp.]|nr:zf-HC2 domain-containing protein [Candidatus Eisenbacteria bacterium]